MIMNQPVRSGDSYSGSNSGGNKSGLPPLLPEFCFFFEPVNLQRPRREYDPALFGLLYIQTDPLIW